jgi:hypothetical protein
MLILTHIFATWVVRNGPDVRRDRPEMRLGANEQTLFQSLGRFT